jgi:prophage antirepressor-like protein
MVERARNKTPFWEITPQATLCACSEPLDRQCQTGFVKALGETIMTNLSFEQTTFTPVTIQNTVWLGVTQIGLALGYATDTAVVKLYNRNADEFTPTMTQLVEMDTAGGKQQVRVFSLRGTHLLAMFARTEKAKAFRKWVLDVLDAEIEKQTKTFTPNKLNTHQARFIQRTVNNLVKRTGEPYQTIYHRIKEVFDVAKYDEVTQEQFPALCQYLGVVYEGEHIAASKPIAHPTIPQGKMLVDQRAYQDMERMIQLHRERLTLLDKANSEMQHAYNLAKVVIEGHMNNAMQAVRTANTYLYDPIREAHTALRMSAH